MRLRWLVCFACVFPTLFFGPYVFPQQSVATAPLPKNNVSAKDLTRSEIENFLTNARIIGERPAPKGITHTRRLVLTDGHWIHDAHVQDIDIYKAEFRGPNGIEKNFRDSYKFNIAAYRVDKLLHMDMVPVCVPREVDGKPSAVDWWVDNVQFDEEGRRDKNVEPPDENSWVRQLNEIRDFDQLIYNEDRNQGNLLIDRDWKLWAIDHSRSFRPETSLRDPKVLRRISNKLLNAMRTLDEEALRANLLPYVTEEDVRAVLIRRDLLLKFFAEQIQTKGEDAVLTDMPRHTPVVTIP